MERIRAARTAWSVLALLLLALGLVLVPAPATSAAAPQTTDAHRLLLDAAGWHGRAVQLPHRHDTVRASTTSPPRGWSAGTVALGAGLSADSGSRRVREVQRRLRRLGNRPGPVDGIYGPRTRAAVAWFQRKHGLPLDGRASPSLVLHLRQRAATTGAPRASDVGPRDAAVPAAKPWAERRPSVVAGSTGQEDAQSRWPTFAAGALVAVGLALLALGLVVEHRRRKPRADSPTQALPIALQPATATPEPAPRALGYVRLAPGAPSASFHAQAAAIEAGCLARGLTLVSLVSDREPDRHPAPPPALGFALERLRAGEVERLVVSRLDHLASTQEDLGPLLRSIAGRRAGLVVLDRDVDTAAFPGALAPDELLRRRAVQRAGRPPARAGEAVDAHIAAMLEEGASPEDISAALNAEPVPVPQGERWSPDGIQAALRRRRSGDVGHAEHADA